MKDILREKSRGFHTCLSGLAAARRRSDDVLASRSDGNCFGFPEFLGFSGAQKDHIFADIDQRSESIEPFAGSR